ncbi:MAG: excinuclease ABC subunit UvrC, partial [Lachnospiraceae bacterium]|nr:excinuclease ABC subunit UvrC [Lachnospiraceae bacterium]
MTEEEPFDIREELKKLPHRPGVYIMRDDRDGILYVGKAVDLHNRVHSYFRTNIGRGPQIDRMVARIARFEYIVTDSELEALVLENNLIKEHRPKYNTLLKDDKTYPFIQVTVTEEYPRIRFTREIKKDGARYFGPFISAQQVRDTIDLINKLFGLRTCGRSLGREGDPRRACLNYHMKQCSAPCIGRIDREAYLARVEQAITFLNGDTGGLLADLEAQMQAASGELRFEEAARLRDLRESVLSVTKKQKVNDAPGVDRDVIGTFAEGTDAAVQLFFVRDGRLIGREHYFLTQAESEDPAILLGDFVKQFYAGTPFVPKELYLPVEIPDMEIIGEWLSERKGERVHLIVPRRGQRNKLLQLAGENAKLLLNKDKERIRREEGRTIGAVKEIAELLGLSHLERMEAYDISNTSGFANVGSMIVFEKGKPKRSDYRKFRIRTVAGPDDYAC